MQLNIEEQIPIKATIFRNFFIGVPVDVRNALNWNVGDKVEMYATTKGIFIKKADIGGE